MFFYLAAGGSDIPLLGILLDIRFPHSMLLYGRQLLLQYVLLLIARRFFLPEHVEYLVLQIHEQIIVTLLTSFCFVAAFCARPRLLIRSLLVLISQLWLGRLVDVDLLRLYCVCLVESCRRRLLGH